MQAYGAEEQCAEHAQESQLGSYTKSVCRSRNSYRQEHMYIHQKELMMLMMATGDGVCIVVSCYGMNEVSSS